MLGCGKCGYAVRGISELVCPECGADLTEVGINRGGKGAKAIMRLLVLLGYTIVMSVVAVVLFVLAQRLLPTELDRYYSIQMEPNSAEYRELGFHIDALLVEPASFSQSSTLTVSSGVVTMCHPNSQITVTDFDIVVRPRQVNGVPVTAGTSFSIDPSTLQATWRDAAGTRMTSQGAFTEQDLLDCFNSHQVDITRADVQAEVKQVHAFATGFINGQHQSTLNNFRIWVYGGGTNLSTGPPWFKLTYILGWVVLWLIGLIWLLRRGAKRAKG